MIGQFFFLDFCQFVLELLRVRVQPLGQEMVVMMSRPLGSLQVSIGRFINKQKVFFCTK